MSDSSPRSSPAVVSTGFFHPGWCNAVVPVLLVLLCLACFQVDMAVAGFFWETKLPRLIGELVENTEPFGHGVGVIVILVTLAACRPEWKRVFLHAGLIVLAAGATTAVLKATIGRVRPRDLDWSLASSLGDTFPAFLPFLSGQPLHASLPSGHTTAAFAFAVVLAAIFPTGRWAFLILASLTAFGRVLTSAHYPSDICLGAAVGWTVAHIALTGIIPNAVADQVRSRRAGAFLEPRN